MNHETESPHALIQAARRDALLEELLGQMQRHHRRRRLRRWALLTCVPALLIAISTTLVVIQQRSMNRNAIPLAPGAEMIAIDPPQPAGSPEPLRRLHDQFVQTDVDVVHRYAVASPPSRVVLLNDDALLDTLAEMNRPAGLIRSAGRVWLTQNVTTEPLRGL